MVRPLKDIIAHIRAVAGDSSISTTLIQTEDLLLLCDAAEAEPTKPTQGPIPRLRDIFDAMRRGQPIETK